MFNMILESLYCWSMIKMHAPPSDQIAPADLVGVVRC